MTVSLKVDCSCVIYIHDEPTRKINFLLNCSWISENCGRMFSFYEFDQSDRVIAFDWHFKPHWLRYGIWILPNF